MLDYSKPTWWKGFNFKHNAYREKTKSLTVIIVFQSDFQGTIDRFIKKQPLYLTYYIVFYPYPAIIDK